MNILIVGGGSIGKRHIKNLKHLGIEDIWVLKRTEDENFAQEFEVKVLTSFQEAKLLELDVVFICTPTALHNKGLSFAKERNLHVFMEKPLIHNEEGLQEAQYLMQDHKKVFFIGFMLRFHPLVQQIKKVIEAEELGPVYKARFEFGSYLPYWHPWEDYRKSYAAREDLGGGVINTITHELDLIQYFFGMPKGIYCEATNLNHLEIAVEEMCEAILDYGDKIVSLHLDYLQKDYDRNIKILCKEGKIRWDWHQNEILIEKHKASKQIIPIESDFDVNQLYIDELTCFFDLIKQSKVKHFLDFQHAVQNTQLVQLMYISANNQRKMPVLSKDN